MNPYLVDQTQRIKTLKETTLQHNRIDGFLIFDWANILYFTGFQCASALLVPRDGESIIFVYGVNYEQAKAEGKNFKVELVKRNENLVTRIGEKAINCNMKRLGVDALDVESWRKLSKLVNGKLKLKMEGSLISELRKNKDQTEIKLMRKAADLTNIGMKTAYEVLSSGRREFEVAADIEYNMRRRGSGGTAFDTAVTSGPRSAFPHGGCTDRKIREGELVVVDFGAVFQTYRCDMTRTFVIGNPSEKQERVYKLIQKAQEAAFKAAKAGIKARDVDKAARNVIVDASFGEFFVHGLGHGIGLEIHEPPILSPNSSDTLATGNVVTIEPGIYLPDYGGCRIEDRPGTCPGSGRSCH